MIEAAGSLATAAGMAAVLEPAAGREHGAGETCANCGTWVTGKFCSQCGQAAHVHRSLSHAVEELLHGVWHFDSKLWRTLPMLLTRPGTLTRDYVMGKRARYISPFALFLLTIFLMFFVFGFTGSALYNPSVADVQAVAKGAALTPEGRARLLDLDTAIAEIDADIAKANSPGASREPGWDGELAGLKAAREAMVASRNVARTKPSATPADAEEPAWVAALKSAASSDTNNFNLGNETLNAKARHALRNPELALYKVQQKGYKLSFLLLPLSLPWMMLLFAWKRDVRTYDHVVFLLYSISFMSLLVLAVALLAMAVVTEPIVYVLLVGVAPPLHMFLQLKGAYRLSTGSALWRTFALGLMAILTLSLYFTLIVALGLVD